MKPFNTEKCFAHLDELKRSCSRDWPHDAGFRKAIAQAREELLLLPAGFESSLKKLAWPENALAVEFGAGTGIGSMLIAPHVGRLVALDVHAERLAVAERLTPNSRFGHRIALRRMKTGQSDFPDGSVDVAIALRAEPGATVESRLAEAARILKPGGLLIFGTVTPQALLAGLVDTLARLDMAEFTKAVYAFSQAGFWRAGYGPDGGMTDSSGMRELEWALSLYGFQTPERLALSMWPQQLGLPGGIVFAATKKRDAGGALAVWLETLNELPDNLEPGLCAALRSGLPERAAEAVSRLEGDAPAATVCGLIAASMAGRGVDVAKIPHGLSDALQKRVALLMGMTGLNTAEGLRELADEAADRAPVLAAKACLLGEDADRARAIVAAHLNDHPDDWRAWGLLLLLAYEARKPKLLGECADAALTALVAYAGADADAADALRPQVIIDPVARTRSGFDPSTTDPLDGRRVLHGRVEIAGNINRITTHLRKNGVYARGLDYYDNWLEMQVDHHLHLNRKIYTPPNRREQALDYVADKLMADYDIFHFHFGASLYDDYRDLDELKQRGKKIVFSFWGSDVRATEFILYNQARFMGFKPPKPYMNNRMQYGMLKRVNAYADVLLGTSCFPRGLFFPGIIDPANWKLEDKEAILKRGIIAKDPRKTYFVHAPTKRWAKGSRWILTALEELKAEGLPIETLYVHKLLPEKAREVYAHADVAIDQISVGTFGLFAMEMFAWKIPVMVFETPLFKRVKQDAPVVNITYATLKDQIRRMVEMKQSGELEQLGEQSRAYMLKVANIETSMPLYIDMYQTLLNGGEVKQHDNPSWRKMAEQIERGVKNPFYRYMREQGILRALGLKDDEVVYDTELYE